MPAVINQILDDSLILQNQRIVDMNPVIQQLENDVTQLTTMLLKLPSKKAGSQKVEWLEDELLPRLTTCTTAYTSGDTAIPVFAGTGQYFRKRDIVQNARTGENMLVTNVVADTLTVVRGYGSVVAAAGQIAPQADDLVRLGNVALEGDTLGEIRMTKKIAQYNICQIQRNPFGVTETLAASLLYGGSEPEAEAKKKLIEHKRDMEQTLFFGRRNLDTTTVANRVAGACGGLIDFCTANVTNIGGVLTQALMEAFLLKSFRYGSRKKVFFCSPIIASALSQHPASKLAINSADVKTWGISLQNYQSSQGDMIQIVVKRDWYDYNTAANMYGGWGFLVDMDKIALRPLRSSVLKPHRQANDQDSNVQEYLAEYSLEVNLPRAHAVMKGVTG